MERYFSVLLPFDTRSVPFWSRLLKPLIKNHQHEAFISVAILEASPPQYIFIGFYHKIWYFLFRNAFAKNNFYLQFLEFTGRKKILKCFSWFLKDPNYFQKAFLLLIRFVSCLRTKRALSGFQNLF